MNSKEQSMRLSTVTAVLRLLRMAYPGFYHRDTDQQQKEQLGVWMLFFGDLPADEFRLFEAAVAAFVENDTSGFPPSPGQVKGWMRKLSSALSEESADAVWEAVKAASGKNRYEIKDAYEALPEDARAVLGGLSGLREIASAPMDGLSYAENRFKKKLEALRETRRTRQTAEKAFTVAAGIENMGLRQAGQAFAARQGRPAVPGRETQ